jgi:amidase
MMETVGTGAGPLWRLSATALAELLGSGQISSRETVRDVLERVASVNPSVNAVTRVLEADALAAADRADRELANGRQLGRLHGVPVSVKENVDVMGSPTTQGARALADAYPPGDAVHVGLLKAAGAIVVSRTNLSEFATRWDTDNELYGPTVNPWRPGVTAGGSSGGEAVALATGMSPLGFGNDDGGSLRYPAQCEGICSLKPSRGCVPEMFRVSSGRYHSSALVLNVQGPMARTVGDLRLALRVIGLDIRGRPWDVASRLSRHGSGNQSPRVALMPLAEVATQVADGVRRAGRCLEQAGYGVVEAQAPRVDEAAQAAATLSMWDLRCNWDRLSPLMSESGRRHMEMMVALAGTITADSYRAACDAQRRIIQDWRQFQRRYPLVLAPVSTQPPFAPGADLEPAGLEAITQSMATVVAVNLLGVPAVVVPTGLSDGLPQVAQIIGARHREDLCLDAAEAIEAAIGVTTPIDPRL